MTNEELQRATKEVEAKVANIEFQVDKENPTDTGIVVKPGVYLYPQARQYGNPSDPKKKTFEVKPTAFEPSVAARLLASRGWGFAPNMADPKTAISVVEQARDEFKKKEDEQAQLIADLQRQLAEAQGGKKQTAKV